MDKKPLIGVTAWRNAESQQLRLKETYMDAVYRAGGLPVVLPCLADEASIDALLDYLDGVLLSGGNDIHPRRYGEEVLPCCGEIDERRDEFELLLVKRAIERDMPIFGICRGFQVLAVALGATLFQDLEAQLGLPRENHRQEPPYDDYKHTVRFKEGSLLARITQTELMPANSMHHQAIKEASDRINIEGITMDGIIEAISMKGNDAVFAVEFHPEYLAPFSDFAARMFTYFVDKAGAYRQK